MTKKNILSNAVVTGAMLMQVTVSDAQTGTSGNPSFDETIRPFHVQIPEEKLVDLKRRILATMWPEPENVKDESQGVQFATMQAIAKYWSTEYDWRKVETRLNALPQFITTIDGVDIHFIHVRSNIRMHCLSSSLMVGRDQSLNS